MNVRTLCLSFLYTQDASGYEIRKLCTEGGGAYFVEASFGSIYPALAKLEDDGLVTSRIEHQDGKPSKKIYSITETGRAAFCDALHEPLGDDIFRSPFLLFARFAHLLDADLVRSRIEDRLAYLDSQIAELKELQRQADSCDDTSHANDAWVIGHGITCLEVAHRHLHTHMNALIASARPNQARLGQQAAE
tara:strand:+ start:756 stop:1328 length:573 start_codon:yes stop_codon:yes gene_type:complete